MLPPQDRPARTARWPHSPAATARLRVRAEGEPADGHAKQERQPATVSHTLPAQHPAPPSQSPPPPPKRTSCKQHHRHGPKPADPNKQQSLRRRIAPRRRRNVHHLEGPGGRQAQRPRGAGGRRVHAGQGAARVRGGRAGREQGGPPGRRSQQAREPGRLGGEDAVQGAEQEDGPAGMKRAACLAGCGGERGR